MPLAGASFILIMVAVIAALAPARRATDLDTLRPPESAILDYRELVPD